MRFAKFDISISLFHEHLPGLLEWTAVVADLSAGVSYCDVQGQEFLLLGEF